MGNSPPNPIVNGKHTDITGHERDHAEIELEMNERRKMPARSQTGKPVGPKSDARYSRRKSDTRI
jgi:hypothetical protein